MPGLLRGAGLRDTLDHTRAVAPVQGSCRRSGGGAAGAGTLVAVLPGRADLGKGVVWLVNAEHRTDLASGGMPPAETRPCAVAKGSRLTGCLRGRAIRQDGLIRR